MLKLNAILKKIISKLLTVKQHLIFEKKVITIKPAGVIKGHVLVSYLIKPFRGNKITVSNKHTNEWECVKMVSLFLELGYSVDIINFDNYQFLPKKDYFCFLDIHSNMERLAPHLKKECIKILHITGCHWLFQNTAEYARLLDVQRRKKVTLMPRRMALPSLGIENCDVATILGNKFTESTFAYSNKPIHRIHITTTKLFDFNEYKDFEACKQNFLWYGGAGMVLKGLDITLEAFIKMPDYKLYVVGPVSSEKDFVDLYMNELYHFQNIKTLGWLSIESDEFLNVLNDCVGIILPSCSEGGGGSVITGLHAGLLPIVSYEASVDVLDFGITLNEISIAAVQEAINKISILSKEQLKLMSYKSWKYAREFHTRERFETDFRNFLSTIISTRN